MARFDEFREANERYAASFDEADLLMPPAIVLGSFKEAFGKTFFGGSGEIP